MCKRILFQSYLNATPKKGFILYIYLPWILFIFAANFVAYNISKRNIPFRDRYFDNLKDLDQGSHKKSIIYILQEKSAFIPFHPSARRFSV